MPCAHKMSDLRERNCVNEAEFYGQIEQLKSQQKTKDSRITCYLEDDLYDKAKHILKEKTEKQLGLSGNEHQPELREELGLSKWEQQTITRKKWVYNNGELFTENNKKVVPKRELFQVLSHAHSRISHRGRQITEKWLQEN